VVFAQEFLAVPSARVFNLRLDANGRVVVPLSDLQPANRLAAAASSGALPPHSDFTVIVLNKYAR